MIWYDMIWYDMIYIYIYVLYIHTMDYNRYRQAIQYDTWVYNLWKIGYTPFLLPNVAILMGKLDMFFLGNHTEMTVRGWAVSWCVLAFFFGEGIVKIELW